MRLIRFSVIIILITLAVGGGYYYFRYTEQFPSTSDSYVQAHIANVASRMNGIVDSIQTRNYSYVKKGDVLITMNNQDTQLAVKKAQAGIEVTKQSIAAAQLEVENAQTLVDTRQAELTDAKKNTARTMQLVKQKLYAPAQGDDAIKQLKVATASYQSALKQLDEAKAKLGQAGKNNAKLRQSQAALDQAKLNDQYTRVLAPADGYVANFSLRPGDEINAYQPLFSIVETHTWWVDANFKETQLTNIKPGQPVSIRIDMYPQQVFHGKVLNVGHGSGSSFSVLPSENATGNWVKVTQRFPVKVSIETTAKTPPLRVGASATVTVDTRSK